MHLRGFPFTLYLRRIRCSSFPLYRIIGPIQLLLGLISRLTGRWGLQIPVQPKPGHLNDIKAFAFEEQEHRRIPIVFSSSQRPILPQIQHATRLLCT